MASSKPRIYLASDPLGADLRDKLLLHIQRAHPAFEVQDLGNFGKYYEGAHKAGGLVQQSRAAGGADRAVLFCGTGMGMAVVSNKCFPDVYAAVVESPAAAGNAAAINNANVLSLGGMVFKEEDAKAAVDSWLTMAFKQGFAEYEELLDASMREIPALVQGSSGGAGGAAAAAATEAGAGIPYPSAALLVDGQQAGGWKRIDAMGHDACCWCLLREDLAAAAPAGGGTRVRALVRFPAGSREPAHHHSHGHDVLVLRGDKSVTNHATGATARLGTWGYLYTPARQSHSVVYHADTVFLLGMDGPLDILWDGDAAGVQWESEAARQAAEAALPWQPAAAPLADAQL